jgi:ribosomal protein S18 acetylase RimI-like enzyme
MAVDQLGANMAAPAALPHDLVLTLEAPPPPGFGEQLGEAINAFMAETVPGELHRFALRLTDADGVLVGGLSGRFAWGWLFVAALWVHHDRRGQGAGRALLAAAESHAVAAGCHSVWLDTFQSREFYERLGYTVFGALEDYPQGQTRYFLRKRLA